MSAPWDRKVQRSEIKKSATIPAAIPGLPGLPVVGKNLNQAGTLPGSSRPDHTHEGVRRIIAGSGVTVGGTQDQPIISVSGGSGITSNRLYVDTPNVTTLTNVGADIPFPIKREDPLSAWGVGNTTWTAPAPGSYLFVLNLQAASSVDNDVLDILLLRNGAVFVDVQLVVRSFANGSFNFSWRTPLGFIVAGSTVKIRGMSTSGVAVAGVGSSLANNFSVIFLGS